MNESQQTLATEQIGKLLFKYSMPAIIAMSVNGVYMFIDRLFIANIKDVGPMAMAGVGISVPVLTVLMAFSIMIAAGTATSMSLRMGEGNVKQAQDLVGNAITLAVIAGVALTILYCLFGGSLLKLFGASDASFAYAKKFMDMLAIGIIPWVLTMTLSFAMRADGSPKRAGVLMVFSAVLNTMLAPIFIFVLDMGIAGAGLATSLSEIITMFLCLEYYVNGKSNLKFEYSSLKLQKPLVVMILFMGMTPFSIQAAMCLAQIVTNNVLLKYGGDLAIGAMTTIMTIITLFLMPVFGLTQGMQPIVGFNYGAGNFERARQACVLATKFGLLILVLGIVVTLVFPEKIIWIFNKDTELLAMTFDGIRKDTFTLPLVAIAVMGSNYFLSIGKVKLSMVLSLMRQILVLIPTVIILPIYLGLNGVWFAQPVGDIISTFMVILALYYEFKSYKMQKF